jgi:hypothetical protein
MHMTFVLLSCSLLSKLYYRASTQIKPRLPPLRLLDQTQSGNTLRTALKELSALRWSRNIQNTQQSQETNIHDLGGIRTLNPSSRAAADLRLNCTATGISVIKLQIGGKKIFLTLYKIKIQTTSIDKMNLSIVFVLQF